MADTDTKPDETTEPATEQGAPVKDTSFDDAFNAAFDAHPEDGSEAEAKPETKAAEAEETPAKEPDDKPQDEPPDESTDDEQESESKAEAAEEGEAESESLEAPDHWPAEDRDAFTKLDEAAQALVLDRDKAWQSAADKRMQDVGEQAKFAEGVQGLFTEAHKQQMALAGLNQEQSIARLIALQDMAQRDPAAYLLHTAQTFGVDLASLVTQPGAANGQAQELGETDEFADPQIQTLRQDFNELKQTITTQAQQAQMQSQAQIQGTLQAFATAKDEDGTLKHPHYTAVSTRMGALLQSDPVLMNEPDQMKSLEQAYESAVFADPTLRQAQIEKMTQATLDADNKQKDLEKAKRAKSPVKQNSRGSAAPSFEGKSLDDVLDLTLDQLGVE